jgi:hypothetical protein
VFTLGRSSDIVMCKPVHMKSICLLLILAPLLFGCASSGSNVFADAPTWLGGEPADVPPRPGTPAYEAWQAQRAKDAIRPRSKDEVLSPATVN